MGPRRLLAATRRNLHRAQSFVVRHGVVGQSMLSLGAALAMAVGAAVPVAADETIAALARPSPVAVGQGVVVWESWDPSRDGYRLHALRNGRVEALGYR